ncbi:MAG: Gfo/Idh/MocA family oxidoreductase [Oscillospiraceae bacterium]|nr:Gfo/Idh/MocA family oxidoreductase [Oscillospiraceae bacterium]
MKTYGLGIIGYGGIGRYHFNDLARCDRLHTVAACDIDPARLELALKDGVPLVCDSAEKLLAMPDVDVVLVSTPNVLHEVLTEQALRAGKHVVCEKPAAMNSAELERMMETAKQANRLLTIHQNRRIDPDFLMVKAAVEQGLLGKPYMIESRVHGARGIPEGWRQFKVSGGGMMFDWGVHLIDQVMQLDLSPVVSVFTHMLHVQFAECDDYFKLLLRFEDGLCAHIEVGTCNFEPLPRWYVAGDRGTLCVYDWECRHTLTRAKDVKVTFEEEVVYTPAGPTKTMAPRSEMTAEQVQLPVPAADYIAFYKNLVEAMDGAAPLKVPPEEALRVMRVMEAAFESQENGTAVQTRI